MFESTQEFIQESFNGLGESTGDVAVSMDELATSESLAEWTMAGAACDITEGSLSRMLELERQVSDRGCVDSATEAYWIHHSMMEIMHSSYGKTNEFSQEAFEEEGVSYTLEGIKENAIELLKKLARVVMNAFKAMKSVITRIFQSLSKALKDMKPGKKGEDKDHVLYGNGLALSLLFLTDYAKINTDVSGAPDINKIKKAFEASRSIIDATSSAGKAFSGKEVYAKLQQARQSLESGETPLALREVDTIKESRIKAIAGAFPGDAHVNQHTKGSQKTVWFIEWDMTDQIAVKAELEYGPIEISATGNSFGVTGALAIWGFTDVEKRPIQSASAWDDRGSHSGYRIKAMDQRSLLDLKKELEGITDKMHGLNKAFYKNVETAEKELSKFLKSLPKVQKRSTPEATANDLNNQLVVNTAKRLMRASRKSFDFAGDVSLFWARVVQANMTYIRLHDTTPL